MFGIDLGTTNSLIAVFEEGKAKIIPNVLGEHLTPSIVGINDDGSIIIGKAAQDRLITHPQLTVANFKRKMGTDHIVTLGEHSFRSEELSAFVLKALKADAEVYVGHPIKDCVISVPAYFNDIQRRAVRAAGLLAGLEVHRVINEPTAAAITYGLHQQLSETQYLVLDIGGGTFDVSLLEFFDGVLEIKASSGDNYLGGEDFLSVIIEDFLVRSALTKNKLTAKEFNQLKEKAEESKRLLNSDNTVTLEAVINHEQYHHEYTTEMFTSLSEDLLKRFQAPIFRVLRDSAIKESEIDQVVLVGGASRMKIIQTLVAKIFKKTPQLSFNPDEAIALGASIQAELKKMNSDIPDIILTDVCPYTLGIAAYEQTELCYSPIIERNTAIPVSKLQTFYKNNDAQTQLEIKVFQGESLELDENILLGNILIDVPSGVGTLAENPIDIRFTYDVNGILDIDVTIGNTDIHKNLILEKNPGLLSEAELQEKLKALEKLKIHPRESTENLILINHAKKIYEASLGIERENIKNAILEFKMALDSNDDATISESQATFRRFLETFDVPLTLLQ